MASFAVKFEGRGLIALRSVERGQVAERSSLTALVTHLAPQQQRL